MILQGLDFGNVWMQSGVQGFFGEGYWYHRWLRLLGLNLDHATFTAKTVTAGRNEGNMPLKEDGVTPQHLLPDCVVVKWLSGVALNSVGLSNPGVGYCLETHNWQKRRDRFFLSFMPIGKTSEERFGEMLGFRVLLGRYLESFRPVQFGIQLNKSCPNVGLASASPEEFVQEAWRQLDLLGGMGIPVVPKFSVTTPPALVAEVAKHPECGAVCVSNTIPWMWQHPHARVRSDLHIDWEGLFGSKESPLAARGYPPGGLSGGPLLPLLCDWLEEARRMGFPKPIAAGGGLLKQSDVDRVLYSGGELVQAINIGSVTMLRPWRVRGLVQYAHKAFERREVFRIVHPPLSAMAE